MAWQHRAIERAADLERLLHDLEQRLARLSRTATRASRAAPAAVDRIGEPIAAALGEMADRFRGRASTLGQRSRRSSATTRCVLGNERCASSRARSSSGRCSSLAVAVGVGALAAGIFARRG